MKRKPTHWPSGDIKLTPASMKAPFESDGFIDRKGMFYRCDAMCHETYSLMYWGKSCRDLEKDGWIMVWSYQSFLSKEPTPYFRFMYEPGPNKEQIDTMVEWCQTRKVPMVRAFGRSRYEYLFPDRPDTITPITRRKGAR